MVNGDCTAGPGRRRGGGCAEEDRWGREPWRRTRAVVRRCLEGQRRRRRRARRDAQQRVRKPVLHALLALMLRMRVILCRCGMLQYLQLPLGEAGDAACPAFKDLLNAMLLPPQRFVANSNKRICTSLPASAWIGDPENMDDIQRPWIRGAPSGRRSADGKGTRLLALCQCLYG